MANTYLNNTLIATLKKRYQRWINNRLPAANQITLNQSNLFIFLSVQGGQFLLLILLLWLGATNYQNNLAYGLCFLLLAILFVVIHYTFANVSGLTIKFVEAKPVFAGEVAQFQFVLEASSARHQIEMMWKGEQASRLEVATHQQTVCYLTARTVRRGVHKPGRFLLKSTFPMGVVQCWTWLDLCAEVLVYPAPIEADYALYNVGEIANQGAMVIGTDDYFALKNYVTGEPLSRIAWKQHAAGRGLFVREYVDYRGADMWLDYWSVPDADPEIKLSKLCYAALQLHEQARLFGLRLPDTHIEPSSGQTHLDHVLAALARCAV